MKKLSIRIAMILAAVMLVSGMVFAPIYGAETEPNEPVEISEAVEENAVTEETVANLPVHYIVRYEDGRPVECSADEINLSVAVSVNTVRSQADLVAALGASNVQVVSSADIKLVNDIDYKKDTLVAVDLMEQTYVIDFNGHTISGLFGFVVREGSNVTFMDSSANHDGGISVVPYEDEGTTYSMFGINVTGGKANIKSGNYTSDCTTVLAEKGELRIEDGCFATRTDDDFDDSMAMKVYASMTKADISGGLFVGESYGLMCYRDYSNDNKVSVRNPLSISGGTFQATSNDSTAAGIAYYDYITTNIPDLNEILSADCFFNPSTIDTRVDTLWDGRKVAGAYTAANVAIKNLAGIRDFVNRLYTKVLDRQPDNVGFENWVNQFRTQEITGASAAFGFFFSQEFEVRKLSNRDFVTLCYNVILNRTPDTAGLNNWVSALEFGASRKYVFAGVVNSQEWKNLCDGYGIEAGSYTSEEARDQNLKVTAFAQRLYTLCLNRSADVGGLNYWTGGLLDKTQDGAHTAYGFFFSKEFIGRNLSNADYVEVLYQVLLGRGSDPAGKTNWIAKLDGGATWLAVFKGFVHSVEFDGICKEYGIVRGSM